MLMLKLSGEQLVLSNFTNKCSRQLKHNDNVYIVELGTRRFWTHVMWWLMLEVFTIQQNTDMIITKGV